MNWLFAVLLSLLIGLAAVAAWARTLDVPAQRYHRTDVPDSSGDYPIKNGFTAVREVGKPAAALEALSGVAGAAARTMRLAGSPELEHVSYVTRSRVFGFPDVTNIWTSDGRVHVQGRSVVGRGDMGVNRRRVTDWMARAGIA